MAVATRDLTVKFVLDSAEFEKKMDELHDRVVALKESFNALREATDGEEQE